MKPSDVKQDRFWSKVEKTETCWNWTASLFSDGYGKFGVLRKNRRAHRISFLLAHGELPADLQVLHHCDNRRCVRPDHLFLGTHRDNMVDRNLKGRQARGERSALSKFTDNDVRQILSLRGLKTQVEVGELFGTPESNIGRIWAGGAWAHIYREFEPVQYPSRWKLSEAQAREIYTMKGGPLNSKTLGARYGVSYRTIRDIWTQRCWKWIHND